MEPHPTFRLFGAMNPANDAGKRDLPPALRARFTELWVDDPDDPADIACIVSSCLSHVPAVVSAGSTVDGAAATDDGGGDIIQRIVRCYVEARALAAPRTGAALRDGSGGRPHYSIRRCVNGVCAASEDPSPTSCLSPQSDASPAHWRGPHCMWAPCAVLACRGPLALLHGAGVVPVQASPPLLAHFWHFPCSLTRRQPRNFMPCLPHSYRTLVVKLAESTLPLHKMLPSPLQLRPLRLQTWLHWREQSGRRLR